MELISSQQQETGFTGKLTGASEFKSVWFQSTTNCVFFEAAWTKWLCWNLSFGLFAAQTGEAGPANRNHTDTEAGCLTRPEAPERVLAAANRSDIGPWNCSMMDLHALLAMIYPLQLITRRQKLNVIITGYLESYSMQRAAAASDYRQ